MTCSTNPNVTLPSSSGTPQQGSLKVCEDGTREWTKQGETSPTWVAAPGAQGWSPGSGNPSTDEKTFFYANSQNGSTQLNTAAYNVASSATGLNNSTLAAQLPNPAANVNPAAGGGPNTPAVANLDAFNGI